MCFSAKTRSTNTARRTPRNPGDDGQNETYRATNLSSAIQELCSRTCFPTRRYEPESQPTSPAQIPVRHTSITGQHMCYFEFSQVVAKTLKRRTYWNFSWSGTAISHTAKCHLSLRTWRATHCTFRKSSLWSSAYRSISYTILSVIHALKHIFTRSILKYRGSCSTAEIHESVRGQVQNMQTFCACSRQRRANTEQDNRIWRWSYLMGSLISNKKRLRKKALLQPDVCLCFSLEYKSTSSAKKRFHSREHEKWQGWHGWEAGQRGKRREGVRTKKKGEGKGRRNRRWTRTLSFKPSSCRNIPASHCPRIDWWCTINDTVTSSMWFLRPEHFNVRRTPTSISAIELWAVLKWATIHFADRRFRTVPDSNHDRSDCPNNTFLQSWCQYYWMYDDQWSVCVKSSRSRMKS